MNELKREELSLSDRSIFNEISTLLGELSQEGSTFYIQQTIRSLKVFCPEIFSKSTEEIYDILDNPLP